MQKAAYGVYKQKQITTASPGEVLLALYDGAIRYSLQAKEAIVMGNPAKKGENLGRVMAIIGELKSTLEYQRAPELCRNLERLYNYFIDQLHEASVHMKAEPIDAVVRHLRELRTTWAEAVKLAEQQQRQTVAYAASA